ncbi:MAG: flagellar export chaperone FliS [Butyrivibrio sp.]|nr:flagellar export chaperone FliS [Butyrivibrio sp.]
MTIDKKKDYTLRISGANSTQLITILYEMELDYIKDAQNALQKADYVALAKEISNAQNVIDELIQSLDLNYELARNLIGLYLFEKKELLRAAGHLNINCLEQVEGVFKRLHEAYVELEKQDNRKSLMVNTQEVYAGLTYGKNSLVESMTFNKNRGYTV